MKTTFMATIVAASVATTATASPIGTIDIVGLGDVRLSLTTIDFGPAGGGGGDIMLVGADGDFANLPLGTVGTITDVNMATSPPGVPLAQPIGTFLLLPSPGMVFSFNVEQILLGSGVPCVPVPVVGQSCSPTEVVPNTPFLLTQLVGAIGLQFGVRGSVTNLVTTDSEPYQALFTTSFAEPGLDTIHEFLAALQSPGNPLVAESSWTAQLSNGVGEEQGEPCPNHRSSRFWRRAWACSLAGSCLVHERLHGSEPGTRNPAPVACRLRRSRSRRMASALDGLEQTAAPRTSRRAR